MSDPTDPTEANPTVRMSRPAGYSAPEAKPPAPDAPDDKHSALVGYMSVPVHRLLPIRRSTLLLIVLFLGFGTLCYLYPPATTATVITCNSHGNCTASTGTLTGGPPTTTTTTTTTTVPPTTTTTVPPTTTTTATTTRPTTTTTTTTPLATTTTRASGSGTPTTTSASTTTTSPGAGAGATTTTATP